MPITMRLVVFAALLVLLPAELAVAQSSAPKASPNGSGPSTNAEATPNLELSASQKQTIYTSITNLNIKNAAPANFQPIVGAVIPPTVKLEKMPKTIAELTPRLVNYEVGLIANQVVIADPKDRKVIEVIAGEKK